MYICLTKNRDGSHGIQMGGTLQPGWAFMPDTVERPETFPYVDLQVEYVTYKATATKPGFGRLEVVSMTAADPIAVEDPEPEATPDGDSSVWDELDAAYQEGVDSV